MPSLSRLSPSTVALPFVALILAACASAAPASSGLTSSPTVTGRPSATASAGGLSAAGLCASFTEALATAALGGPVSAPQSGDVLPRPSGVYCHYNAATGRANTEAQLNAMDAAGFAKLASTIGTSEAVSGVGEKAFKRDTSITGDVGVTLAAWAGGRGVTVTIFNPAGQSAQMLDAAKAIAQAALAP